MQPFAFLSLPAGKKQRLYLIQLPFKTNHAVAVQVPTTVATLEAAALEAAADIVTPLLGKGTEGPAAAKAILEKGGMVPVSEEEALRIGLIFAGIEGMRSNERVAQIIEAVKALEASKVSFWMNELSNDPDGRMKGAFRHAMTGAYL
jgi:hypothetical protein